MLDLLHPNNTFLLPLASRLYASKTWLLFCLLIIAIQGYVRVDQYPYLLTLFIADIALLALFMPAATEVWACIACKMWLGAINNILCMNTRENHTSDCKNAQPSKKKGIRHLASPAYELQCLSFELDFLVSLLFVVWA